MSQDSTHRYFWCFVIIQAIVWTLLPTVFRYALPHDTIEGAVWGQHLAWGYDKNPWLNAWLTRLGTLIGGSSGFGIYLMSSIGISLSFWAIWQLAREYLPPFAALASTLLLEGTANYTLVPQSFNDNLLELALWPLMFYYFYCALHSQSLRHWLICASAAGLAMMAKYYTAIPLTVMGLFLCVTPQGRISFKNTNFYWGCGIFILWILPNIFWLFQHQFITLNYALNRTDNIATNLWQRHFYYPLHFITAQIADFAGAMILFLLLLAVHHKKSSHAFTEKIPMISSFQCQFLFSMAFGPLLLTIIPAGVCGWKLYYNEWGIPLISLWGIVLLTKFRPTLHIQGIKRFLIIVYTIMILMGIGYVAGLFLDHHPHSDNYPAQQIANYVTQQWWQRYHKPLKYVAGSRYIAGYIAFYSADHPSVYVEWNDDYSPWINIHAMQQYGAVFIQDNYYGTTVTGQHPYTDNGTQFPVSIQQRFPQLQIMPIHYFYWHRNGGHLSPIPVLIGFLPPQTHQ